MKTRRAVVFDLDGTLIDSVGDIAHALNRVLTDEGRSPLAVPEVARLVGEGARVLIARACDRSGIIGADIDGLNARFQAYYRERPTDATIVYPGVRDALARLRALGWLIGLCTNKPDDITRLVLERLDLAPLIDAVVGGDFPRRKPDGAHVLAVLEKLGVDAGLALYVGDSGIDCQAARAAGVPMILVTFGYANNTIASLGADLTISDFDQLCDAIEILAKRKSAQD